jgi:hypothetical protein
MCTVHSPAYRKSRATTAVRGKVACQKATDAFCVVSLGHLSQFSKAREKSEKYNGLILACRFLIGGRALDAAAAGWAPGTSR